ncbi:MAG: hypothetical protein MUD02_01500 [Bacteroidales bacterium]|nr:hypothetical protein [Bacteroidales bacterium]MCU0407598.1 hypothetical protein [Bacteroidales bacterium]
MKILSSIIIFFALLSASAAQGQNPRFERIDAFRIGFFTKRLNLSPKEAEMFWPVYNDYQDKKTRIQLDRRAIIRDFNQNEASMSDRELATLSDKLVDGMVRESALSVELHKKLKEIFPPAKVIRFYQVENLYKAQLLNELQSGRRQVQPGIEDPDPGL